MRTYHITINMDGLRFMDVKKSAQNAYFALALIMEGISPLEQKKISRIVIQEIN